MNVRVVLFAKPRELVGQPNLELALPAGATAADAWSQLSSRYDLGPLPRSFRCAVIAVTASHRGEAFDACEWLIDELKHTVPIWKKEVYTEGEAWIDDRP